MTPDTLPPVDLQRFQAFLARKGYQSVTRSLKAQQRRQARARRMEVRAHGLAWPNCTAEIKGYSVDSKGQKYAIYTNGRLVKVPSETA